MEICKRNVTSYSNASTGKVFLLSFSFGVCLKRVFCPVSEFVCACAHENPVMSHFYRCMLENQFCSFNIACLKKRDMIHEIESKRVYPYTIIRVSISHVLKLRS